MEMTNFKKVNLEKLGEIQDLVLYYPTQKTRPILIRYKDIPWAIINTPMSNRAIITDMLDCFICDTFGNLLNNMSQMSSNFKWRARLLELEEQLEENKISPQVVEFAIMK